MKRSVILNSEHVDLKKKYTKNNIAFRGSLTKSKACLINMFVYYRLN